jgi:hypothetical protein
MLTALKSLGDAQPKVFLIGGRVVTVGRHG